MPVWALIIKYWKYIAIGLLLATNAFTLNQWQHTQHNLTKEKTAHATDIAIFKAAQDLANKNAQAERDRLVKEGKENAAKADASYAALLNEYRTNLLRYKAHQSRTRQAANHKLPTAESGDGPGESTDVPGSVIVITMDDAQ
jgi:uncharacterized protein YlxW (UPF0749 family)